MSFSYPIYIYFMYTYVVYAYKHVYLYLFLSYSWSYIVFFLSFFDCSLVICESIAYLFHSVIFRSHLAYFFWINFMLLITNGTQIKSRCLFSFLYVSFLVYCTFDLGNNITFLIFFCSVLIYSLLYKIQ